MRLKLCVYLLICKSNVTNCHAYIQMQTFDKVFTYVSLVHADNPHIT